MPYGVRLKMIGSGPDWLRGTKILVFSRLPSRIGIITSDTSKRSAGFVACCGRTSAVASTSRLTTVSRKAGAVRCFMGERLHLCAGMLRYTVSRGDDKDRRWRIDWHGGNPRAGGHD